MSRRPRALLLAFAAALSFAASITAAQIPLPVHPPEGLQAMREFARNLLIEGFYDESVEAFRAVAQTTPGDVRSHYDLAGALSFLRRYEEAIPSIEAAIALVPDEPLYHELAAVSYQQLRHFDLALEATHKGAELGDVKAMYSLAGMYEHGQGTAVSLQRAHYWLRRAAEAGHLGAMDGMARVYSEGLYGESPDENQARRWRERLRIELNR